MGLSEGKRGKEEEAVQRILERHFFRLGSWISGVWSQGEGRRGVRDWWWKKEEYVEQGPLP